MSYARASIKDVVLDISRNKYLLPAIQREVVWNCEQIEKLFDSILSGYPINSMLFWKYRINPEEDTYKFYEFLKSYDEYTQNHNTEHNISGESEVTAVLDGQQRLTALFIGLKGYMNLKKPYYRSGRAENYEKKFLYINLLNKNKNDDDTRNEYEFKFKTQEAVEHENSSQKSLWFQMENLLRYDTIPAFRNCLPEWYKDLSQEKKDRVEEILHNLQRYFIDSQEVLNFYQETTDSLDRALTIFVRINSGGTPLDYTDFLMSMIVSRWSSARDKINNAIDVINNECNFNLPKDIFLRACLYLTDAPLTFKADNFKANVIEKIENQFKDIVKYLKASCRIFNQLGYSKDNLRSNLIVLPVAQFLFQNNKTELDSNNMKLIERWVQLSILARVFGAQTTSYLTQLRKEIKNTEIFPLQKILQASIKSGRSMSFDDQTLYDLIEKSKYSTQLSWAILTILYPNNDYRGEVFHEDHIYPQSKLSKKELELGGNFVANLQLLKGLLNIEKKDMMPEDWIKKHCDEYNISIETYKNENYIPLDIPINKENFSNYIQKRKELIFDKLKKELS